MDFEEYSKEDIIIRRLCRLRVKSAQRRHKMQLLYEAGNTDYSLNSLNSVRRDLSNDQVRLLLPPRRQWVRLRFCDRIRFGDSQKIMVEELFRTTKAVRKAVNAGRITSPDWNNNLTRFIGEIQDKLNSVSEDALSKPTIRPVRKEKKSGCTQCRPISLFSLQDRMIIGITAKYFTDLFDEFFENSSYAFRATKKGVSPITHHDTIKRILHFRNSHNEPVWVAEGDINKFFDCINHEIVRESLSILTEHHDIRINSRALALFNQYLNIYSFNKDILPLNSDSSHFDASRIHGGEYSWPMKKLEEQFYNDGINNETIGIPQGGALSCFIANLVLDAADKRVHAIVDDKNSLYLRYCDDMVILSVDRDKCKEILDVYLKELHSLKLVFHDPCEVKEYSKGFWDGKLKSKSPYLWAKEKAGLPHIPWLSFVGYQIRYSGELRVRKKSIEKEKKKQWEESQKIYSSLGVFLNNDINESSRKALKQQIFALKSRLVSMSAGRVQLHDFTNQTPTMCWASGFKLLTNNKYVASQLKELDRSRNKQIHKMTRRLSQLTKKNETSILTDKRLKNSVYHGCPHSYFGIVKYKQP